MNWRLGRWPGRGFAPLTLKNPTKTGQRCVPIGRHRSKSAEAGEAHPSPGADLRHMRRNGRSLPRRASASIPTETASTTGFSTESAQSDRWPNGGTGREAGVHGVLQLEEVGEILIEGSAQ